MHALAFILCFAGFLFLAVLGEKGALFQLLSLISGVIGAVAIAGIMIALVN